MLELELPSGISDIAAAAWDDLGLDQDLLHDHQTQQSYRRAVSLQSGGSWDAMTATIADAMEQAPFAAVVRGGNVKWADRLLAVFAASFGQLVNPYRSTAPGIGLWMDIVSKAPTLPDQVWLWHTDSANWPTPNDYSVFTCLSAAPSGGATEVLSLDTMRASEGWQDDVLGPLAELEFAWPLERVLGGGTVTRRAITPERLTFRRELMLRDPTISPRYRAAVDRFAGLSDQTPPDASALLAPGDLLIFNNRRAMHRSGTMHDPDKERRLLRTKVVRHDG
jgi:hypothetical protein